MSYLLSVDPGLRKAAAALWHDGALLAAQSIGPKLVEGDDPNSVTDAVEAMATAVCEWKWEDSPLVVTPRERAESNEMFLVCEYPQTYGGRAGRGDANDLIAVALVAGAVLGRLACSSRLVLPHEWKGSIKKPQRKADYERDGYVVETRVRAKLGPEEARRVEWPRDWKKRLDVADALGIGLWALGR